MQAVNSNPFYLLPQWDLKAKELIQGKMGDKSVVVLASAPCELRLEEQCQAEYSVHQRRGKKQRKFRLCTTRIPPRVNIPPVLSKAKETIDTLESKHKCLRPTNSALLSKQAEPTFTPRKLTEQIALLLGSDAGIIETLRAEVDQFKFGPGELENKKRSMIESCNQHIKNLFSWNEPEGSVEQRKQMASERIQLLKKMFPEFLRPPPLKDPELVKKTEEIMDYFHREMESLEDRNWEIFHPEELPPVEESLQLMKWARNELAKEKLKSEWVSPDISKVNTQLFNLNQYISRLIKENNPSKLTDHDCRSIVQIYDEIKEKIETDKDYKYFRLTLAKITPAVEELRTLDKSFWRPAQEQPASSVQGYSAHSTSANAEPLPSEHNDDGLTLQGAEGVSPEACAPTKQQGSLDSNIITEVKELLALAIKEFNENQPDDEKRISVSACAQALTYSITERERALTIEVIAELVRIIESSKKEEPNISVMVTPLLNTLNEAFADLLIST